MDFIFVGAIVGLAALTALLIAMCDRLRHSHKDQS
jgi:hypothetical protein